MYKNEYIKGFLFVIFSIVLLVICTLLTSAYLPEKYKHTVGGLLPLLFVGAILSYSYWKGIKMTLYRIEREQRRIEGLLTQEEIDKESRDMRLFTIFMYIIFFITIALEILKLVILD